MFLQQIAMASKPIPRPQPASPEIDCWIHVPNETCPRHGKQWSPSSSSPSQHAEHDAQRVRLELLHTRALLADLSSRVAQLEHMTLLQHDRSATQHYSGRVPQLEHKNLAQPGLTLLETPRMGRVCAQDQRAYGLAAIYGSSNRPLSAPRSRSARRDGTLLLTRPPLDTPDFVRAHSGWWCHRNAVSPELRAQGEHMRTPTPLTETRPLYSTPANGRSGRRIGSPVRSRRVERARPLWAVFDRNWALHLK
jgi:hypothetical protein